jgi:hypothetical protein
MILSNLSQDNTHRINIFYYKINNYIFFHEYILYYFNLIILRISTNIIKEIIYRIYI